MRNNEDKRLRELEALGHKFVLIASNSTKFWRADIRNNANKIITYSLVNLTEPTNLCSPEINFPTQEVYYRFKNYKKFDECELTNLENNVNDGFYYLLENENVTVVRAWGSGDEETEEEIIEYLRGNPIEL